MECDNCQRTDNVSKRNAMPMSTFQVCEVFYCWGIGFMGPFPNSFDSQYILVAVEYVPRLAEA